MYSPHGCAISTITLAVGCSFFTTSTHVRVRSIACSGLSVMPPTPHSPDATFHTLTVRRYRVTTALKCSTTTSRSVS